MSNPGRLTTPFKKRVFLLLAACMLLCLQALAQTPKITGFSPSSACQGATVTITGTNLKDVKTVKLGNQPAGNIKVINDNTITADIDGSASGGKVIVSTADKSDTSSADLDIKITPKPALKDIGAGDDKAFTNCDGNANYTLMVQNISTDVAAGSGFDINWGDGTAHFAQQDWGAGATTTHKYTSQGYFTITISISPPDGCTNKQNYSFYNGSNPLASLTTTTSTTGLCTPAGVNFIIGGNWANNSAGTVYQLDYGDGQVQTLSHPLNTTGSQQTVPHTYTKSSCPSPDFTATLNVINGCFTTTYTLNQIVVREKPTADFDANLQVCLGDNVCFTNKTQTGFSGTSCSSNTSYTWDFGDGTQSSSSENPDCHKYATAGNYTITLSASNLTCGSSTKTKQVVVRPVSPAPVTGAGKSYCQNTQAAPLQATGVNLLWYNSSSAGNGSSAAPTPSTATPGTYTWYVSQTLPGDCESPRVPVTVTVVAAPQAGISYPAMCSTDKTVAARISGMQGGTFSSAPGLSLDAATGSINPSLSKAGHYVVTYTIPAAAPCNFFQTTTDVTITQAPSASVSYTPSALCNVVNTAQTPNPLVPVVLTGTGGGRFTISPVGLTIDNTTGSLDPSGAATGNYTVTYTMQGTGGCGAASVTTAVSVSRAPTASISYSSLCTSDLSAAVNLQGTSGGTFKAPPGLVINASTGAINPAASTPGTYTVTYIIAPSPPCTGFTTTTDVTVTKAASATISYPKTNLCNAADNPGAPNGPVDVMITGDNGGAFSISPGGLAIDAVTGRLTPAGSAAGNYTIRYTLPGSGGCTNFTATATVSVNNAPSAAISYPPVCSSDNTAAVQLTGAAGGTFSSTAGLVIDPATGTLSPAASKPGSYTVTYTIPPAAPCPGVITTTKVTITPAPAATISYAKTTLCNVANSAQTPNPGVPVAINGNMGGSFSISQATGLAIDPVTGELTPSGATAGNYTVTYSIAAAGGCSPVTTTTKVSVSSAPRASISYPPICSSDPVTAVQATGDQGGVFTAQAGLSVDKVTGAINPAASTPGTYTVTYTIAAEAPCPGFTTTATVTVTKMPYAVINYPKTILCNVPDNTGTPNPKLAVTVSGDKGGTFTISPAQGLTIDPVTGTLTPSGATPGSYTISYTLQGTGGCSLFTTSVNMTVNDAAKATLRYPGSPYCGATTTLQLPVLTGTQGGIFTAGAGLSIDASTGAVNPAQSKPGVYTVQYTIAAAPPCPGFATSATVEISASPRTGFDKNDQAICSGGTVAFTPSSDVPQTVFNWALDGTLPGGVQGPVSGSVTGSGVPITLSYTNTASSGQILHISVSPVNPAGNPCPGAPYQLVIRVNPVPGLLTGDTTSFCMHAPGAALSTNPAPGDTVHWFDLDGTPFASAPVPSTQKPDTLRYLATQTNVYGCESQPAPFVAVIHPVAQVISSAFTNPTSCGLPSGSITLHVTDLNNNPLPNTPVTMFYSQFGSPGMQHDTTDGTGNIIMPLAAGQYSALVVNTYGCPSAPLNKTFELIDPDPPAKPLAGYNDTLCTGTSLVLSALSATGGAAGPLQYVWAGPAFGNRPDTTQQTAITFTNAALSYEGTYIVYAVQNNCISPAVSFPVTIKQGPARPSIVTRTPLCTGDLLTLQAYSTIPGNYPLEFTWNGPGRGFPSGGAYASIPDVLVSDGGVYSVTVTSPATGCSVTADTLVRIGAIPLVSFQPDSLNLPTGFQIPLVPVITNGNEPGVLPVSSYAWSPATGLACNNDSCSQPVLTVSGNNCYSVKVTNVYGCAGTAAICVQAFCNSAQVFIPNAFTPRSGLGENRVFMVRASGITSVKSFRVFNRWGKVVFEKHNILPNDPSGGWDGTVNGKPADTGVYIYIADVVCENGVPYSYKGNVTLLQ